MYAREYRLDLDEVGATHFDMNGSGSITVSSYTISFISIGSEGTWAIGVARGREFISNFAVALIRSWDEWHVWWTPVSCETWANSQCLELEVGFGCNVKASRVVIAYATVTNRAVLDKDLNVIYEMVNQFSFETSNPGYFWILIHESQVNRFFWTYSNLWIISSI